jgi:hypothetical protein
MSIEAGQGIDGANAYNGAEPLDGANAYNSAEPLRPLLLEES